MYLALADRGPAWLCATARTEGMLSRALDRVSQGAAKVLPMSGDGREGDGHAGGSQGSFEALFRVHEEDVQRLCRRMLGGEAARDASQEIYLRGRRGFESWDPERPFRRWLLAVAGNHCIDQIRRRSRETRIFDPSDLEAGDLLDPGPSPLRLTLRTEEREHLLEAIDSLPQKYRVPLVLRYFQELDYDGISEVLGVSRGQVGTLLFRAKRRLREALAGGSP